jgi:hypothetical protein
MFVQSAGVAVIASTRTFVQIYETFPPRKGGAADGIR